MAKIIEVASLTIKIDEATKNSVKLKKEIETLKQAQKELDTSTDEGAAAYERLGAQIKNSSKEYRDSQKLVAALDASNKDLNATLAVEGKTRQELLNSRNRLNEIAKSLNLENEKEAQQLLVINRAIDDQTAAIRASSSAFNDNKDRVGEYRDGVMEVVTALKAQQVTLQATENALKENIAATDKGSDEYKELSLALQVVQKDLNSVNTQLGEVSDDVKDVNLSLDGFIEAAKDGGSATEFLAAGANTAKTALIATTKAAVAFIATPLGVVVGALAAAYLLVVNATNRSEESSNKLKQSFAGVAGVIKVVLKALEPLGEYLIDGIAKGFEIVESAAGSAARGIANALEFVGFDDAASSVRNVTAVVGEAASANRELVASELELQRAQREARKIQLEYQKDAEDLRQIRDDENRSIAEKIAASDKLGGILAKQGKAELSIAQQAIDYANLRIKLEGETAENLDLRAQALTEFADIQERINGQESEQLVNRVALQKEAADQEMAIAQSRIAQMDLELKHYLASQGERAKTLQEQLVIERESVRRQTEILNEELNSRLISQQEYNTEVLTLASELRRKEAELIVENAKSELDAYIATNQSRLSNEQYLSDESVRIEQERLAKLAEAQRQYEATRLEQGTVTTIEYNNAINAINEENRIKNEELRIAREEAEKERQAIDLQNKIALNDLQFNSDYERRLAQLERERQAEVAAAEKAGADTEAIEKKYQKRQQLIDKEIEDNKIEGYASVLSSYASIMGEQTAIGKSLAIAATTIDTYVAAQKAYKSLVEVPIVGPALAAAAAASAVIGGLQNVAKIAATPTTFARGGVLQGASHANGGIPFTVNGVGGFEAEGGEAIINKKSTSKYRPLLSAINVAGGGRAFADGGMIGAASSAASSSLIDYDQLAARLGVEIANITPVLSVEEFSTVSNQVRVVETLANL